MYQVITLYGDNEPWWFFEEWEEDILEEEAFQTLEEAKQCYEKKCEILKAEYSMMKEKPDYLTAFWNEGELRFCDDCDEDVQQYKGLMILKNCRKLSEDGKEDNETVNYSGKAKCCKRPSQSVGRNEQNENVY